MFHSGRLSGVDDDGNPVTGGGGGGGGGGGSSSDEDNFFDASDQADGQVTPPAESGKTATLLGGAEPQAERRPSTSEQDDELRRGAGAPQRGLFSTKMALITSDYG